MHRKSETNRTRNRTFDGFVAAIDDAAEILGAEYERHAEVERKRVPALPGLLEQCAKMRDDNEARQPEPIRTIHHFACTGGTLISKCLASMPNTQILSEVDPLSAQSPASSNKFFPTDFISLLRQGSRSVDDELLIKVFVSALDVAYQSARSSGLRMIIRDHAHSHFCAGDASELRPSLREIIAESFSTRTIVTVRHPLDSYLSLNALGWINFRPGTLDGYCLRYHRFLDCYASFAVYRYEDFINDPLATMERMCADLEIPFNESFPDLFFVHSLSGDSGRSANTIAPRRRRPVPEDLKTEIAASEEYASLCRRLGYESETVEYE